MTEAQKETKQLKSAAASRKHYMANRERLLRNLRSVRAAAKLAQIGIM